MLPEEIVRKIRRIQITAGRLADESLAGEYHSVFKGRGMEFEEVREYQHGDDIRTIDWNVTSRTGRAYVKRYVEERELTVMLLIDTSASGLFGSSGRLKSDIAAELSAIIAFSAIKNNDRVGAILFTDVIEKFIPPRRGARHVLRVIREVLYHRPERRGTGIREALDTVNRLIRKRAVVVLISDMLDEGFEQSLPAVSLRHDLMLFQILDPRERELPDVGVLELCDAETGKTAGIDTSLLRVRDDYRKHMRRHRDGISRLLDAHRIDHLVISTDAPYEASLARFFRERARRRRRT
ncbi:MAG TPA: DUF58 domain-containing protein [Acidobacteriota bacterium]|nr:DUF58 domain-containing protein [Acidobacteriota bacterium]